MWMFLLRFVVAFVAIASLLLLIASIISAINNPQIDVIDGKVQEKGRNTRIWLGLITSVFWALFLTI